MINEASRQQFKRDYGNTSAGKKTAKALLAPTLLRK
jgi:hypothetical protein